MTDLHVFQAFVRLDFEQHKVTVIGEAMAGYAGVGEGGRAEGFDGVDVELLEGVRYIYFLIAAVIDEARDNFLSLILPLM